MWSSADGRQSWRDSLLPNLSISHDTNRASPEPYTSQRDSRFETQQRDSFRSSPSRYSGRGQEHPELRRDSPSERQREQEGAQQQRRQPHQQTHRKDLYVDPRVGAGRRRKDADSRSFCGISFVKSYEEEVDEYYAELMVAFKYVLDSWKNRALPTEEAWHRCDEIFRRIWKISVIDGNRARRYLIARGVSDDDREVMEKDFAELQRSMPPQQAPRRGSPRRGSRTPPLGHGGGDGHADSRRGFHQFSA